MRFSFFRISSEPVTLISNAINKSNSLADHKRSEWSRLFSFPLHLKVNHWKLIQEVISEIFGPPELPADQQMGLICTSVSRDRTSSLRLINLLGLVWWTSLRVAYRNFFFYRKIITAEGEIRSSLRQSEILFLFVSPPRYQKSSSLPVTLVVLHSFSGIRASLATKVKPI